MQLNPIGPKRKEKKHAWSGLYPLTLENNKTKQGTTQRELQLLNSNPALITMKTTQKIMTYITSNSS